MRMNMINFTDSLVWSLACRLANMLFQMENVKRAAWMLENVLVHHCTAVIQSLDITKVRGPAHVVASIRERSKQQAA